MEATHSKGTKPEPTAEDQPALIEIAIIATVPSTKKIQPVTFVMDAVITTVVRPVMRKDLP